MAIPDNIDDGGEDRYGEEWEGGPIELGPIKRDAAPDNVEHLDQELANLEANEPEPGDNTQIDDPGISPIPEVPGEELLGQEVAELEAEKPFDYQKAASEPAAPDVGEADTSSPPEHLSDYLKEVSSEPEPENKQDKPLSARQKRGLSRVPGGNPTSGQETGSMDDEGGSKSLEDADIRNRDTVAKQSIDHMRRIEEITERLLAART
jgi:hypothetical protein